MIRSKYTTPLCACIVAAALVFTCLFCYTDVLGIQAAGQGMGYESRLFDDSKIHAIDIIVEEEDWQTLLDNPMAKEYVACTLCIDGEKMGNAAIRAKGNTSLSSMAGMDSQRYSFKVEFDHYVSGRTYHGLDKLSLNNLIYDTTYMKDYLAYDMMRFIGADAPLASFANITVNGEAWGLYLAVEAVEDAFLQRNYGGRGQLYKPDSMQLKNDMQDMRRELEAGGPSGGGMAETAWEAPPFPEAPAQMPAPPEGEHSPGGIAPSDGAELPEGGAAGGFKGKEAGDGRMGRQGAPAGFGPGAPQDGGPGGGAGKDVALQYIDDDPQSYGNIFDSAKTAVTQADKARLIASLKQLSQGENLEEVVDIEEVLRYFVAHNFVVSFDSYTGSMLHNYYLHEDGGRLSMVAWDYNLAFGTFSGGGGSDDATAAVNYPIDTPVSGTTLEARPLLGQLLAKEEYLAAYHEIFRTFLADYFESGYFDALLERVSGLLSPYIAEDASAFYGHAAFLAGVEALRSFCSLRAQSVRGQLDGLIPATQEGQRADASALVDASGLSLHHMGTMSMGRGGGPGSRGMAQ